MPPVELRGVADEFLQERNALSGEADFQTNPRLGHNLQPLGEEEILGGDRTFASSNNGKDSDHVSLKNKPMVHGNLDTIQEGQETAVTCDQEDTYSSASGLLQHPDAGKFVSAFAEDLSCSLPAEFDVSGWEKVSSRIPFLLKTSRLGSAMKVTREYGN